MGRITATAIHLSLCVAAGVGFVLFVIPRWWELMGETSHTLGTVFRIAVGVLVALAALPVVLTLVRTRAPEAQTPAPALTLRMWSAGAHVVAGALIIATAITEIWVTASPWLYGVYGGAITVALLGATAFYLAFVAEKPPALPKAAKPKKAKKKRGKGDEPSSDESESSAETDESASDDPEPSAETNESAEDDPEPSAETNESAEDDSKANAETDESADEPADAEEPEPVEAPKTDSAAQGALRNKRPSGKSGHRLRRSARTGAATDDA